MGTQATSPLPIPALRPLTGFDFVPYHALRQRALATDPLAFHTTLGDWHGRTRAEHERRFRHTINHADNQIIGAWQQHKLVGMVGLDRFQRERVRHKLHVWGVYLVPEVRGRGWGSLLLDYALQIARNMEGISQVQLTVMAHNQHALHLYQSRGFVIFGHEKAAMIANGRSYDELHLQCFL